MNITIQKYNQDDLEKWDRFVMQDGLNGTFMHTMNFLSYHIDDLFEDCSLMFYNGSELVAVLPGNIVFENGERSYISHGGATFGGLVLGKYFKSIKYVKLIFEALDTYLGDNDIHFIKMKFPHEIYCDENPSILEYFSFLNGYEESSEIGYYIDFNRYNEDIATNFTGSKRRDYRYSLKYSPSFKELTTEQEYNEFYSVLCENYSKFKKTPVHSLPEILRLKNELMKDDCRLYGVYEDDAMVAGGMVYFYKKHVFHTQYLAAKQNYINKFVNNYLYFCLIDEARKLGFERLAFGTSTFDGGRVLNESLAQFKEGFGTTEFINRTYTKTL